MPKRSLSSNAASIAANEGNRRGCASLSLVVASLRIWAEVRSVNPLCFAAIGLARMASTSRKTSGCIERVAKARSTAALAPLADGRRADEPFCPAIFAPGQLDPFIRRVAIEAYRTGAGSGIRGNSAAADCGAITARGRAEHAPVFAAELRGAFIADLESDRRHRTGRFKQQAARRD